MTCCATSTSTRVVRVRPAVPDGVLGPQRADGLYEWRAVTGEVFLLRELHGRMCAKTGRKPLRSWVGLDEGTRDQWGRFVAAHMAGTLPRPEWVKPEWARPRAPWWTRWGDAVAWSIETLMRRRKPAKACRGCRRRRRWLNRLGAEVWWAFR